MRRALRAGIAAGLGLALALAGTSARGDAAGDLSPTGSASFSDIAACTAEAGTLLVSIVVDESQSLQWTDPEDQRVGAVLTALDSLERLGGDTELAVEANLAVFGSEYTELVGWGSLEPGGAHGAQLRTAAQQELPERDGANLTDYRQALSGAQTSLAARSAEVGGDTCKMMLWLTDGRLDVDGRGDRPATDAAREEICAPGGIIDGVRADGVAVVAMGLMTAQGQGAVDQIDRDRFQAIAEGAAGSEVCGTAPVPGNVTNGAFLTADDASLLNRLFAQMGALLEGGTPADSFDCPSDACVDGRLAVPVDAGVGGFRLVVEAADGAPAPQLVAPDGTTVVLDAATAEASGAAVSVTKNETLTTIDVAVTDPEPAVGTWTMVTDADLVTVVDLYYFWGVTLTVEAPDGVVIGEPSDVRIAARDAAGGLVAPDVYGAVDLTVTVDGAPAPFAADADGWSGEITVPADAAVSSLVVAARATAETTPNAIALGPVAVERALTTSYPPSFPTISPARLELGRLDGTTTAEATLTLTGADRGPTEVCFSEGTVAAPERAGAASLAAGAECLDVAAGATVEVPVTLTTAEQADGRVDGLLPVELHGVDPGDPIVLEVPVTGTMLRPVDAATRNWLVAVLVGAALAFAYGALVVTRRIAGRFDLSPFTRYVTAPVVVTARGPQRRDGATRLLGPEEFRGLGTSGRPTTFTAGTARYWAHRPWNPFAEARALVSGTGSEVPMTQRTVGHPDPSIRLTDFPGSTGFVIVTERPEPGADTDTIRGTLVMVVDPGKTASVAQLLPDRLAELDRVTWSKEIERAHRAWADLTTAAPNVPGVSTGSPGGQPRAAAPVGAAGPPSAGGPGPATGAVAGGPPPPRRGPDNPPPPDRREVRPAGRTGVPPSPATPSRPGGPPGPTEGGLPPPPPPRR
ncbi:hypothetical protein EXU48_13940 [Occultella glacieicola]|uniref:VWFA domain-containing protein n=1 Tax=Occultella glacieicola TaxID=2518684 RepID=A0ABY2E204_9MICO|nr:hypothetical protein [Occultella glacieicola]TDE92634.1 hypothetical protein EXU48_13940 [Occultella glacieicola]